MYDYYIVPIYYTNQHKTGNIYPINPIWNFDIYKISESEIKNIDRFESKKNR